ncbi:MAG: ATP-binding protein [Nitrospiria bacterium]
MLIVELALINIRHFKEAKKFLLKPGFNLIHGANGAGKTTLFNVIKDVFLPSYVGYSPEASSQAAISFRLNNGEIYRLLRHFSKQFVQLYKLDPQTNKFGLIEKEEEKIRTFLFSKLLLGDFTNDRIIANFFLDRSALPSLNPYEKRTVLSPVIPATEKKTADDSQIKSSLEDLKKQEAKADLLAQKESEMLDSKDKIFSIKRTLNELETIETELSGFSEKEKMYSGFSSVPREIDQLIEDYEKAILDKTNEEQQLLEEKEIIEQQLSIDQQNLLQNKFLWTGGVIVLFALFLPFFLDVEGVVKQIDLVALLLGIGLALFSLIRDFNKISQKKVWNVKLENKNKNIEILNAKFQREHLKYFSVLQKTGCSSREEFETKFSSFKQMKADESALLQKKQSLLANKPKEVLLAELIEASEKADVSEREINQLKPGTRDPYIIQQEIKALEDSLSSGSSQMALDVNSFNPEEGIASVGAGPSRAIRTFFEVDWELMVKMSQLNPGQINLLIQKKIANITGSSISFTVNEKGEISLNPPQETLSPGVVDQIFLTLFCVRLELLKNISFPLLLDDPLITLDPGHQALILSSLKELSKVRQVILLSNTPYPIEAANYIKL